MPALADVCSLPSHPILAAMNMVASGSADNRILRPGARLTLLAQALFLLGFNLSGVFVNIFLFRVGGSLGAIGWYHFYQYVGLLLGFLIAGQWAKRSDRTVVLRIGTVVHALFFLIILLLGERAADLVRELGLLLGVGGGFFWLGSLTVMFDLTNDDNRDRFYGLHNILWSAVTMIAPFIAGAVLARVPGTPGYRIIFLVSFVFLVSSAAVTLLLRHRDSGGAYNLWDALHAKENPQWRHIMWINGLIGIRDGVFVFLVGLLLYIATGNEFTVGAFVLLGGAVTVVMSWVVGARVNPTNRRRPLTVGFFGTALSPLVLVWNITPLGILLFILVEALFSPLYDIPFESISNKVLESDPDAPNMRVEYMVAREIPLNLGRMLGVLAFVYAAPHLQETQELVRLFVAVIGLLPVVAWWAHPALLAEEAAE